MAQATLQCPRVLLVPLADEHFEAGLAMYEDLEVMRYLDARPHSRAELLQSHRALLALADPVPGLGVWAGFVDGHFVGRWTLEPPHRADQGPVEGQGELGYRLLRRYWRQGLASEGSRELIRHGFTDLGLHRIFAETMAVNAASRATMAAVGMEYVRTFHLEHPHPIEGVEHGEVEYAITRARWSELNRTT